MRGRVDILVGLAEKAIRELGYALPEPARLRTVLRQYLAYSLRGRMGEYHHIYMINNTDRSVAQLKLLDFVQERIPLQGVIVTKPSKKPMQAKKPRSQRGAATKPQKKGPKQTAHRRAASKPEVKELIERLRKRWKRASPKDRRERILQLLGKDIGCSIRGLAEDISQPESSVRSYSMPGLDSPKGEKPKALQASVPVKGGPRKAAAPPNAVKQEAATSTAPSVGNAKRPLPLRKLPPRPIPKPAIEKEEPVASLRRQLARIIEEFLRVQFNVLPPPDPDP